MKPQNLICAAQFAAFAACISMRYTSAVIKSFRHDGLQRFFKTSSKAGIQPNHAKKLRLLLARLDTSTTAADMNLPLLGLASAQGRSGWPLGCVGERKLASDLHV
jgi:hypothetical protein